MADVAFGTDTAGSIRVPAACCGIVGLKTTYGLVPIEGVYPVEPKHLDTVGPMGKDIAHTVQGMELLQEGFAAKYAAAKAAKPTAGSIRVGRLKLKGTDPKIDKAIDDALAKTGFQVVALDESLSEKFEQAKNDGNTIAAGRCMDHRPTISTRAGRHRSNPICNSARPDKLYHGLPQRIGQAERVAADAASSFREGGPHRVANTCKRQPPGLPLLNLRIGILEAHVLQVQNTVPVNFAGNPALAVPVPLRSEKSSPDEPAIDWAAIGRGGSAQRRTARRRRGQKVSDRIIAKAFAGAKSASVKFTSWSMRAPLNSVTLFLRGPCTVRLAGIGLCFSSRATRVTSMRRTSSPEDEYFSIRIGTKR